MRRRVRKQTVIKVGIFVALVCVAFFAAPRLSYAASSLTGWAWSDNTGWISLNCLGLGTCGTVNYGLSVADNGTISGYAWSDNIGWISANSADLSGCPSGTCAATLSGTALTGWLKALAANGQGWDGWISLSGTSPYAYGPTFSGTIFSGYLWGSDVVGWIDFQYADNTPAPACTLTATPPSMIRDDPDGSTVTWTVSPGASTFNIPALGGPIVPPETNAIGVKVYPSQTTIYAGTVTDSFGQQNTCSATLTVGCNLTYTCTGAGNQTIHKLDTSCVESDITPSCNGVTNFCSPGSPACLDVPPIFNPTGTLTGHLQAIPSIVTKGDTTRLYWDVGNVSSCTVTDTDGHAPWTGIAAPAGGQQSWPIMQQTIFTLNCTPIGNATFVPESVPVNVVPIFEEPDRGL